MAEKVHLYASQRVNRKARTDNEEIFTEKVSLITNKQMSIGKLADFKQLVADMETAGIAISTDKVVIKAKQTMVVDENNNTTALFANGKLNAALIDADTITVNHLYARKTNGGSVVGHFGNADKADAQVGSSACPLWVGATAAANAPFRVASDGSMYSVRGRIGGFAINETSIGSENIYDYDEQRQKVYIANDAIIFNDRPTVGNTEGQVMIGPGAYISGTVPQLLSLTAKDNESGRRGAYIDLSPINESDKTLGNKYGLYVSVAGGNLNYAVYAKRGNISADEGWIGGAKYNKLSLTATYTELDMRKNNVWIVANNSNTSERRLVLPSRLIVNMAIGRADQNSTTPFCAKVFIVVHRSSRYGFHVNARGISSEFNNEKYPYMYDCNGTKFSEHDMSPGDSAEFLLIYDGTEYYAQLTQINK